MLHQLVYLHTQVGIQVWQNHTKFNPIPGQIEAVFHLHHYKLQASANI